MASIIGWTVDKWPFAMTRFLDFYTMIFKEDGAKGVDLYEAYCDTDDEWVATQVIDGFTTIDTPDVYPINIDFADFGWFYIMAYAEMSSGSLDVHCYYRDPDIASGLGAVSTLPTSASPEFISCCNFKGQVILGGILSTDASWTELGQASDSSNTYAISEIDCDICIVECWIWLSDGSAYQYARSSQADARQGRNRS